MRILVTGGAGFIGSNLVDRLVEEGHRVSIVDNLSTGKKKNLNRAAKFYKMDVVSPKLEKVFKRERPEVVSHHAAQMDVRRSVADPLFDAHVNILGFLNVLENGVKAGTQRIIFASSGGAIYGEQTVIPTTEECSTQPLSPYGVSKLSGEHYLYFYQKNSGLDYTSLRYSNVYGPRQDPFGEAGVVAIFAQKMLKGEQPLINGNGNQTRDYVFVEDVVEANMAVLNNSKNGIFNVGTGIETSVNQLFQIINEITGASVKEQHGPERRGEQKRSVLSFDKLAKDLDWSPRVSLFHGLEKTVDFFRPIMK
ncbi:MAG TPA: NAD-dependent epimerase/dehydratase family protein [Nitrospiria bacterium]|jgi:UDP-glucose 4-epimerase